MPYDKSLDVESFKEAKDFESTRISVGVFSYNGGEKKLQVTRQNKTQSSDEWQFVKLGRMNKEEVKAVVPIMMKAVEAM